MKKLSQLFFFLLSIVCLLSGSQIANSQTSVPALEYSDFVKDEPSGYYGDIAQTLKSSEFIKKMLTMKGFTLQSKNPKKVTVNDGWGQNSRGEFYPINPRKITVCDSTYVREANEHSITVTIENNGRADDKRYIVEFSNPEDAIAFDELFKQKYFRSEGDMYLDSEKYKGETIDDYLLLSDEGPLKRDVCIFVYIARVKNKVRILSEGSECGD